MWSTLASQDLVSRTDLGFRAVSHFSLFQPPVCFLMSATSSICWLYMPRRDTIHPHLSNLNDSLHIIVKWSRKSMSCSFFGKQFNVIHGEEVTDHCSTTERYLRPLFGLYFHRQAHVSTCFIFIFMSNLLRFGIWHSTLRHVGHLLHSLSTSDNLVNEHRLDLCPSKSRSKLWHMWTGLTP